MASTKYESAIDIYSNFPKYLNEKYSSFGVYTRVSTENQDQDENGNVSLNTQSNHITQNLHKQKINSNSYNIYSEVCSAYKNNINNMTQLYKCLNKLKSVSRATNKPTLLVIYDISRLSRNINTFSEINSKYCVPGYVEIYSCVDNKWFNNKDFPFDNHEFWSKVGTAYNFSVELSEKQKKSIKYRRDRGDVFGNAPYGYETYRTSGGVRKFRKNTNEENQIKQILKYITYNDVDDVVYNNNYKIRGKQITYNTIKTLERKYGNVQKRINLKSLEKELSFIANDNVYKRKTRNSTNENVDNNMNMSDFRKENNPFLKRRYK